MRVLKFILSLGTTAGLVILFNTKIDVVPPLGKFLDPFHGFWQNAESGELPAEQMLNLKGIACASGHSI